MADTFLRLNGYKIETESKPANAFIIDFLEMNIVDINVSSSWINEHIRNI